MKLEEILSLDPFKLPSRKIEEFDQLPCVPGIYFMWGGEWLLYIGQSAGKQGIRGRCLSHELLPFLKEMKKPRISYLELPGESGRVLSSFEAALIKKHKPLANRHHQAISAKQELDEMIGTIKDLKKLDMLPPILEKEARQQIYQLSAKCLIGNDATRLAQVRFDLEQEIEDDIPDRTEGYRVVKFIEYSHLYRFCQDVGLTRIPDNDGEVGVEEIFEQLKLWYIDQGILLEGCKKDKKSGCYVIEYILWIREIYPEDPWVKVATGVYEGLLRVFPDLRTRYCKTTGRTLIQGLALEQSSAVTSKESEGM